MEWYRWHNGVALSANARAVADLAHREAEGRRTCYPNWLAIERESRLSECDFLDAFTELCDAGVVFSGFPSLLPALAEKWPPAPIFGPLDRMRPVASEWSRIRRAVFERDDYTCQYCGERGGRLECDHVVPVARHEAIAGHRRRDPGRRRRPAWCGGS